MASLTLKVAAVINRPDDEHFHFGYSHFAPLLNMFKAVLILVLCTAAPRFASSKYRIRLLKIGNTLNILVHVKLGPDFDLHAIGQLDDIRIKFNSELQTMGVKTVADVVFVGDMKLAD